MPIGPEDLLGRFWFALLELFFFWSLLGATVGLAAAYFLSDTFGFDQEFWSWTLAITGFVFGIRHDYRGLQMDRSDVAVLGYLGFAAFLMAVQVLLVLSYLRVAA